MGPWMGPWRALASFSCPRGAAEGLWLTQPFLVPYAAWGEGEEWKGMVKKEEKAGSAIILSVIIARRARNILSF